MWQENFAKVKVASAYFIPSSCQSNSLNFTLILAEKPKNEVIATANQNEGKYQEVSIENLVKNDPTSSGAKKRES